MKNKIEYEKRAEWEKKNSNEEYVLQQDKYGFWKLAIIVTLMVAFFPWSLLFCLLAYGMDETIYLFKAIISDLVVVVVGLVLGLVGLLFIILLLVAAFN